MSASCRPWWRNCALEVDDEILRIDRMEDEVAPLPPNVARIRELISSFELCHHKASRWIENILEAIATGETTKGLGTRPEGRVHEAEVVWQAACDRLSEWCAGDSDAAADSCVGAVSAARLLAGLGQSSPLKRWQVERVIDRIRSLIHWPRGDDDPATRYEWLLLGVGERGEGYRATCPSVFREHEAYWLATVRTMIHDLHGGQAAQVSLGLAIDMLWPCHWDFLGNLRIVLDAIGGQLHPVEPYAACGRNIGRVPGQERLNKLVHTLRYYVGDADHGEADAAILAVLGELTPEKRWLTASLEKTILLQLHPPAEMQAATALAGPEWIK